MVDETKDGPLDALVRVLINTAALVLFAGTIALVVATIIHES